MKPYQLLAATIVYVSVMPFASAVCIVPNSLGTADLPPTAAGCEYVPPLGQVMQILPPAVPALTSIDLDPILFGPPYNITEVAGGSLGGHVQTYDAIMQLSIQGMGGSLAGFNRNLAVPVTVVTESAFRTPGNAVQTFATEMISLHGQIFGDPDFDFLEIKAGTGQGLPAAPGVTQLTRQGPAGSPFAVNSHFDLTYLIDFQGSPGSILQGLGGMTVGAIRLQIGTPVPEPASACLLVLAVSGLCLRLRTHFSVLTQVNFREGTDS